MPSRGGACTFGVTMEFDTEAIRRLRDGLLDGATAAQVPGERADELQTRAMLARIEPFAETMYLVMVADGTADAGEQAAVRGALGLLLEGQVPAVELDSWLERFARAASQQGAEARVMQIGAHLAADREGSETAFALAAAVALADERVDGRENRVLEWVQEYFGISAKRSEEILAGRD